MTEVLVIFTGHLTASLVAMLIKHYLFERKVT